MIKTETVFNIKFTIEGGAELLQGVDFCTISGKELSNICVEIPNASQFFWPNREGEFIQSRDINGVLRQKGLTSASICYPATASMQFFIIYQPHIKDGIVLYSSPDPDGKIALFSLNSGVDIPSLHIESEGIELKIFRYSGDKFEDVVDNFLTDYQNPGILPHRFRNSDYQVQLGFFSPYGIHNIPGSKGFEVCNDIAKVMKENIGENNIIHLFSYHGAHDSNYPEYIPSLELGGPQGLRRAIESIHKEKQLCSLYMNARLLSTDLLYLYPELKTSILRDSHGNEAIESYYERDFYIMDPLGIEWRSLLKKKASYLKSLGADIIQLDQVAGRAAMGSIGYKWGYGYRALIQDIEELGLEVWIQGINEIYPVHRFELCYRNPHIMSDGTIRGGHPFGKSYPLIPRLLNNQNFIVPIGSWDLLKGISRDNITIDLEHLPGELSIYSEHYMKNLIRNLKEHNLDE